MSNESADLSGDKIYHYADFKDVFVDSTKNYFHEVATKNKENLDIFETRKNNFKSIINGKTKVKNLHEEYIFNQGVLISSTDINGIITYANNKFCEVSGYSYDELIGKNHNIIRHPNMPSSVFEEMWSTIKNAKNWGGIIKNLRKDGQYYWSYTKITPVFNENNLVGYSAIRKPVLASELPPY